jgi:hypothetical protein
MELRTTFARVLNLISPSFLSGFVCVLVGLSLTAFVFATTSYHGTQENIQTISINNGEISDNPLIARYQNFTDSVQDKDLLPNVSFFVFWSALGLAIYYLVAGLITGFQKFHEFKEELSYVHINNRKLITEAVLSIFVRFIAAVILVIFLRFFALHTVSLSINLARIAAVEPSVLSKLQNITASLVVIITGSHACIILIRLAAFRSRIFS